MRGPGKDTQRHASPAPQAEVISFLSRPDAYPKSSGDVKIIETHAAFIFLAGSQVYKIKKSVVYPYLDFSTLAKRKAACERELEINRPHAPQIYLGVVPICRTRNGELEIGGNGEPVEWSVHMRRFGDNALLAKAISRGRPGLSFYDDLADQIARYHRSAPVVIDSTGATRIDAIIDELCQAFASAEDIIASDKLDKFCKHIIQHANKTRHRLEVRGRRGFVRRCHGDLHLNNIVILAAKPVLFDAIEFNEDIAIIDVLYDLAFLIMDLETRAMRAEANRVLNRYVAKTADVANISGLGALPLFLACRAAIRSMVTITRMHQKTSEPAKAIAGNEALKYFKAAQGFLCTAQPQLICIGGLSGTGKTTVARRLAPIVGRAPGALHLRSDVERKMHFGVEETHRLNASTYTPETSNRIYARLLRKAKLALLAGQSVIIDAVFLNADERGFVERVAHDTGAAFTGFWLQADEGLMVKRVTERKADASDTTARIVRLQLTLPAGTIHWHRIDTCGDRDDVYNRCRQFISR